tara:strand:- start:113 stop:469 length:357 start_codon:yes stop_codon:yes gene_type:complete
MKILLTLSVLFFSSHVFSKDNFVVFGAVSNYCSEIDTILSLNNEDDPITIIDFMETSFQGYLSGLNFFVKEISGSYKRLNEYSTDFMFEFIVEYCQNNPNKRFTDALTEYILILPNIE